MGNKKENEEIKLSPCPFCGCESEFITRPSIDDEDDVFYFDVRCKNKGCYLYDGAEFHFDTKEKAAELWNKRSFK